MRDLLPPSHALCLHGPSSRLRLLPILLVIVLTGLIGGPGPSYGVPRVESPSATGECPTEAAFSPKVRPEAHVSRLDGPIDVDGRLDDGAWQSATRISGFSEIQPGDQSRPPVCTEVWIGYDDAHLYVAFRAYDDPSTVRASLRNRDEMFQDDWVGLILDPFGDAAQAYEIFANPLGVQGDLLMSASGGEDVGFDLVFRSEGRLTADGYEVEMAVPFSSLRFPADADPRWRATFLRTRPRGSRQQYSWSTVSRDDPCFMCQFGTLTGLGDVKPGTNVDVMPAVVGSQRTVRADGDPTAPFDGKRARIEPSVSLRYGVTPSVSLEATVNPDFSQVESDAAQIDVNSTFALSFPERRPFFQEGSDLFDTALDVVYTRSINAPLAAAKTTGRFGRTSVAVLSAVDEESPLLLPLAESSAMLNAGRSASTIARVRQALGESSYVGGLVTDRRYVDAGGFGTVAAADAGLQFLTNYRFEGQLALSDTREPARPALSADVEPAAFGDGYTAALDGERFQGHALSLTLERSARHWGFFLETQQYSPTFRTANGFTTRNDYRRISVWQGYTLYAEDAWLERITPGTFALTEWTFDGQPRESYAQMQVASRWKGQTFVFVNAGLGRERFAGTTFERLTNWNVNVNSNFSEPLRVGANVNGGRSIYRDEDAPQTGRRLNASLWLAAQPWQRVVITPEIRYASLRNPSTGSAFFSGYVMRTKATVQVTRELSMRLVGQYDHFNGGVALEPLVSYRLNPFSVFYVGSTHDYTVTTGQHAGEAASRPLMPTSRQFFFKLQYLFRT